MNEIITREDVKEIVLQNLKKEYVEVELIIDYFYYLYNLNLITENISLVSMIERINTKLDDIIFFESGHAVEDKYGTEFKGVTDANGPGRVSIYVRDSLPTKEMIFYHELTHLVQQYFVDGVYKEGIIDENHYGNIFNEANVQYIAERIYSAKYNIKMEKREYAGSEVRMSDEDNVESDLTNYQMYDNVVTKVLDFIGVSRDEVARMSFDSRNNFLEFIAQKYDEAMELAREVYPDNKFTMPFYAEFKGQYVKNGDALVEYHSDLGCVLDILEYIFYTDLIMYTQKTFAEKLKNDETVNCLDSSQKRLYPLRQIVQSVLFSHIITNLDTLTKKIENIRESKLGV